MEMVKLRLSSISPLMMHADILANPLEKVTQEHKEVSTKTKKTEAEHLWLAKSEFIHGAYWTAEDGFFIPGINFDRTFQNAAKAQRLGTKWVSGTMVVEERVKLLHDAANTPEELWLEKKNRDVRGVWVGGKKIMRYRPIFLRWACELTLSVDEEVINPKAAIKIVERAGKQVGVCELRPRFGRFEAKHV